MNSLESFLKQMAEFHGDMTSESDKRASRSISLYGFVRDYGRPFTPARRPKGMLKMANKMCYANATSLVLERPELSYVEGFAIHDGGIPVDHAWTVTPDGTVVDPTWPLPERSLYHGIIIPLECLQEHLTKHGRYGILTDWQANQEFIMRWKNPQCRVRANPRISPSQSTRCRRKTRRH